MSKPHTRPQKPELAGPANILVERGQALLHRLVERLRIPDDAYAVKGDDSDIEVRENMAGFIECVGCLLDGHHATWTEQDMAGHIQAHKQAGHLVPVTAIPNLLRR